MRRLLISALLASAVLPAQAHTGLENNTEVRLEPGGLRIILRTSPALAAALLGPALPAGGLPGENSDAIPLAAPEDVFRVSAGAVLLAPAAGDYRLEPQNDVVFQFRYPLPAAWPVSVDALFFEKIESLESGTVAVFDTRASRFVRDVEPLIHRTWDQRRPAVTFSPDADQAAPQAPARDSQAAPAAAHPRHFWFPAFLLAIVSVALGLAIERRRRLKDVG